MKIDCTRCQMFDSPHCEDCLVTALLHPPGVVEVDDELAPPLQALTDAGLVPVLRFRGASDDPPEAEAG